MKLRQMIPLQSKYPTLSEILPDATPVIGGGATNSGIFKNMVNVPQFILDHKEDLDAQLCIRYGRRILAPVVLRVYDKNKDIECTVNDFLALFSSMIENEFSQKWSKLYETTILEYNPIWNVDGTETTTTKYGKTTTTTAGKRQTTGKQTADATTDTTTTTTGDQHTKTTNTEHPVEVLTKNELGQKETTTDTKTYPYNADVKPTNSETVIEKPVTNITTETTPAKVSENDVATDGYTVTVGADIGKRVNTTENTQAGYTDTNADTGTDTVTHIRTGNIGVTTTQEMIKKEREVSDFLLYEVVLPDVANFLTLYIY